MFQLVTIEHKKDEKFLRKKTAPFDFSKFTRKEIDELIKNMRECMKKADGIGLAANQVGLDMQIFVAQITPIDRHGKPRQLSAALQKFYAVFNPKITKTSKETETTDEGCLSVPGGYYGDVTRPAKITLEGYDKNGKKLKIKAWGLLARVFQHEVDHLNGALYIDKAKNLRQIAKKENA
ncbi:peptide deformylase [Candidatus Wolfebacteria bacterium]|nr:peptide deformylase [Candidatus Wolfebacteria bacterium]